MLAVAFQSCWEVYSEPSQISKTEYFLKIINDWKPLTIFAKSIVLDVWLSSKYGVKYLVRNETQLKKKEEEKKKKKNHRQLLK